MKIILLKKIKGLGDIGDNIIVKSGYARNYLFPYGYALIYNLKNIQKLNLISLKSEQLHQLNIKKARERILNIKKIIPIVIICQIKKNGKLFGSITSQDISKKINSLGFKINKNEIIILNNTIKILGNYKVIFQPHKEVSCYILINIVSKIK